MLYQKADEFINYQKDSLRPNAILERTWNTFSFGVKNKIYDLATTSLIRRGEWRKFYAGTIHKNAVRYSNIKLILYHSIAIAASATWQRVVLDNSARNTLATSRSLRGDSISGDTLSQERLYLRRDSISGETLYLGTDGPYIGETIVIGVKSLSWPRPTREMATALPPLRKRPLQARWLSW